MDRLSVVSLLGLLACAAFSCEDGASKGAVAAPEPRVNAVLASGKKTTLAELCDVAPAPAKSFSWPELSGAAPPPAAGSYRWVNVWATWCKPCVEELPLLAHSFAEWKKAQQAVTLTLLSVDADPAAAEAFVKARPELPSSLQIKDSSGASGWLQSVGLASGASIPVHLVLNAKDELLCARSGGISAGDLERFHHALFP